MLKCLRKPNAMARMHIFVTRHYIVRVVPNEMAGAILSEMKLPETTGLLRLSVDVLLTCVEARRDTNTRRREIICFINEENVE
jgi:hypothetical protein